MIPIVVGESKFKQVCRRTFRMSCLFVSFILMRTGCGYRIDPQSFVIFEGKCKFTLLFVDFGHSN